MPGWITSVAAWAALGTHRPTDAATTAAATCCSCCVFCWAWHRTAATRGRAVWAELKGCCTALHCLFARACMVCSDEGDAVDEAGCKIGQPTQAVDAGVGNRHLIDMFHAVLEAILSILLCCYMLSCYFHFFFGRFKSRRKGPTQLPILLQNLPPRGARVRRDTPPAGTPPPQTPHATTHNRQLCSLSRIKSCLPCAAACAAFCSSSSS